jgi:hypothetical protein
MNDEQGAFGPDANFDWFWDLIRQGNRSRPEMTRILSQLSKDDLIRFQAELQDAAADLNDEPFLDYLEDSTDDSIEDICYWVVSQGKDYYTRVWNNPSEIPRDVEGDDHTFYGLPGGVFWEKYRENILDYTP